MCLGHDDAPYSYRLCLCHPSRRAFPSRAASTAPTTSVLFDDFTQDTSLNTSLWQNNGPVGSLFGQDDVGSSCASVPLEPTFSSAGMEIAEITEMCEISAIQSVNSFAPPFNVTAVVEGTVSNGHTFVFAISSAGASSGVSIIGNLNSDNCSNLGDCGNPATCGTPANDNITEGQCNYGIDVKTGNGGGGWTKAPKLYLTPSVDVLYTMQISVNASGSAQYSISQGGQVLGESWPQIGTGPFYVILMQAEGGLIPVQGPNVAYWQSVSVSSPTTCAAPPASLALQPAAGTSSTTCASVSVYPTEASFTTITLNYKGQSLSSPIHVAVDRSNFPRGLNVTLRVLGTKTFTKTWTCSRLTPVFRPSSSTSLSIVSWGSATNPEARSSPRATAPP